MSGMTKVQQGLAGVAPRAGEETSTRGEGAQRVLAGAGRLASVVASALPGVGGFAGAALGGAAGGGTGAQGFDQMRAMQQESQTMQLQYMQLQQSVQDDNRRFSTASNIMRAGHDTQKAAIQNIRS